MSKLVALAVTRQQNGRRTYTAFTKDDRPVYEVSVIDCGQGADLAIRSVLRAGYTISFARWADTLARKHAADRTIMQAVS